MILHQICLSSVVSSFFVRPSIGESKVEEICILFSQAYLQKLKPAQKELDGIADMDAMWLLLNSDLSPSVQIFLPLLSFATSAAVSLRAGPRIVSPRLLEQQCAAHAQESADLRSQVTCSWEHESSEWVSNHLRRTGCPDRIGTRPPSIGTRGWFLTPNNGKNACFCSALDPFGPFRANPRPTPSSEPKKEPKTPKFRVSR